jgi:WD40 repeat protein
LAAVRYKAFVSYSHAADGELAPALETALRRFAKPWYRLRAIRVFCDKSGLSVTPDLWHSIEQALLQSEYFLLLASPQSARSKWVEQEIDCWIRNRPTSHLLIVQTDGEIHWSSASADFDWSITSALPPSLAKVFPEEPYYLDLRWARSAAHLSVRRPEFLEATAKLSAALRNQPLDELIGEDVRQHRKTKLLARSAVTTLVFLLVIAILAAVVAVQQRNTARVQRKIAEVQTEQSRQRLVRLNVANGIRQLETGDLSASLLWFNEALKLERSPTPSARTQRIRMATVMRLHPQLTQVWSSPKAIAAKFTPDGRRVEAETEEGQIMVWDAKTGVALPSPPPAEHSGGLKIISDNTVQIWPGRGPKSVLLKHSEPVDVADLSSDGKRVLTLDRVNTLRLFDAETGRYLSSMGGWEGVDYAEFSPTGNTAIQVSRYGWACVWDVVQDKEVTTVHHHSPVIHATFSPDSTRIATATSDNTAYVWDARTGAPLSPPLYHGDVVRHVAFDPDGTRLVTASADGLTRIWDLASSAAQTLKHESGVRYSAFSPDEKRILTITDHAAQLWNLETGFRIPLKMPASQLYFGNFTPDGRRVITTAQDGAVRLWDAVTGSSLGSLLHNERVN